MKWILLITLGIICSQMSAAEINLDKMLATIRELEGVKDPGKRGSAGELGWLHITPIVWKQHMPHRPHSDVVGDPFLEKMVAEQHLLWIIHRLKSAGRPVTPRSVAMCWNEGVHGYLYRKSSARAIDYGKRAENIYASFK